MESASSNKISTWFLVVSWRFEKNRHRKLEKISEALRYVSVLPLGAAAQRGVAHYAAPVLRAGFSTPTGCRVPWGDVGVLSHDFKICRDAFLEN